MKTNPSYFIATLFVVIVALLLSEGFVGYKYYTLTIEHTDLEIKFAEKVTENENLNKEFLASVNENNNLKEALYVEQNKNDMFAEQIADIAGTVGDLEKLSKTDQELLQKYSKVYFLSEHYIPQAIVQIDPNYNYQNKEHWIHKDVWPYLDKTIKAAKKNGVDLLIISAYRSFDEQTNVKEGHVVTYGAGTANQFSAEQGYSEHQLGTTIDFTTPETGADFSKFQTTEAWEWLQDNAHKYGFILSYPEGNAFYQFEPWHWRFVGVKLATKLHKEGKSFYDMDQRDIDEYLISIFD